MLMLTAMIGAVSCATVNDVAFCGPEFTGAINRLAVELDHPSTRDALGKAGTAVVKATDAGCTQLVSPSRL